MNRFARLLDNTSILALTGTGLSVTAASATAAFIGGRELSEAALLMGTGPGVVFDMTAKYLSMGPAILAAGLATQTASALHERFNRSVNETFNYAGKTPKEIAHAFVTASRVLGKILTAAGGAVTAGEMFLGAGATSAAQLYDTLRPVGHEKVGIGLGYIAGAFAAGATGASLIALQDGFKALRGQDRIRVAPLPRRALNV